MELISLELKNFKQYRDQKIEFSPGLTGIIGRNGSGKSTIFEAVSTALYGTGFGLKDHIRNTGASVKEHVSVVLRFEIGGKEYQVTREFRGKTLTAHALLTDPSGRELANGHNAVTGEIVKILGMDREAFCASVFAGQRELGLIAEKTGAERRELVRKMAGMQRIDLVLEMVRRDRNDRKNKLAALEGQLLSPEELKVIEKETAVKKKELGLTDKALKDAEKVLAEKEKKYSQTRALLEKQEKAWKEYAALKNRITGIIASIEACEKNITETEKELVELRNQNEKLKAMEPEEKEYQKVIKEKESLDELFEKYLTREGLLKKQKELNTEIADLDKRITELKKETATLPEIEAKLESLQNKNRSLNELIEQNRLETAEVNSMIGSVNARIDDRAGDLERIEKAGEDSDCPLCLRPLKDAYQTTIAKLNTELDSYRKDELSRLKEKFNLLGNNRAGIEKEKAAVESETGKLGSEKAGLQVKQKSLQDLENERSSRDKQLNNVSAEIKDLGGFKYDPARHEAVKKRMPLLVPKHELYVSLKEGVKKIPFCEKRISDLKGEMSGLSLKKDEAQILLEKTEFSQDEYEAVKAETLKAESERDSAREKKEEITGKRNRIDRELGITDARLTHDKKQRAATEELRNTTTDLDRLEIYLNEFRRVALDRVRPLISQKASELFQDITLGRYQNISLDENFDFFIMDEGIEYPIKRFSGGEQDLANLCLRIAISQAVSGVSGSGTVGFLAFDEIFGSQDGLRRREILEAFHRISDRYRQIFLISHIDEVKDEFPVCLQVTGKMNESVVREIAN